MRLRWLIAILLIARFGGDTQANTVVAQNDALSPEQITVMQAQIAELMNDPESARFKNLRAARDSKGMLYVCGEINGRNKFGGYVGYKLFVAAFEADTPGRWSVDIDRDDDTTYVESVCETLGLYETAAAPKADSEKPKLPDQLPKAGNAPKKRVQDRIPQG